MPSILYQKGEWPLIFSDSINLSDEQVEQMSEEEIEHMKKDRYRLWLSIVSATPEQEEVPAAPSEEQVDG